MCGVVGYVGKPPKEIIDAVVYQSEVRGLHNTGRFLKEGGGIYHTRYITSGETNQPLFHGEVVMAFNGVIDMGTKAEIERRYAIEMETDNDGEIILQTCSTPEEVVEFLKQSKATFAGCFIWGENLIAIRNEGRALWIHHGPKYKILASTKDIFLRAGVTTDLEPLEPFKIYSWPLLAQ